MQIHLETGTELPANGSLAYRRRYRRYRSRGGGGRCDFDNRRRRGAFGGGWRRRRNDIYLDSGSGRRTGASSGDRDQARTRGLVPLHPPDFGDTFRVRQNLLDELTARQRSARAIYRHLKGDASLRYRLTSLILNKDLDTPVRRGASAVAQAFAFKNLYF